MHRPSPQFLDSRAENLAYVFLSRRADLLITRQDEGAGLSLLVRKAGTGPMFGVVVKSTTGERIVTPVKLRSGNHLAESALPILLLYFTMARDEAYYAWLRSPRHPLPRLSDPASLHRSDFRAFDRSALDEVVAEVDQWYAEERSRAA